MASVEKQKVAGSYSTDDEAWRDHERMEMVSQARKDVANMAKKMLDGKDRKRIAELMGVTKLTLAAKVSNGRFTALEFFVLAYLCGYEIKVEDKYQMMLDLVLE